MTGFSRKLGLAVLLSAFAASGVRASQGTDLQAQFEEGVQLLRRGREAEALVLFEQILASDPSQEEAFELWRSTDNEVWLDLLVKEGRFELFAKDLMDRARLGQAEHRSDEAAIRELVAQIIEGTDILERAQAVRDLAAQHGEYGAPALINYLGDQAGDERRTNAMHALIAMDTSVVLPLIEALRSQNALQRRNAAIVLGEIRDPRAAAALAALAAKDPEAGGRSAAEQALAKLDMAGADAVQLYLEQGKAYRTRHESVLRPYQYSDVVWSLADGRFVATPTPREVYNEELAERAFQRALALEPSSVAARAGLAQALTAQSAKLAELAVLGQDVAEAQEQRAGDRVTLHLLGVEAFDAALASALEAGDARTAASLAALIGETAAEPTPALTAALSSGEPSVRAGAALAASRIAMRTGAPVGAGVLAVLSESAGREVLRLVGIVDGDEARSQALAAALEGRGIGTQRWSSGAMGLARIGRLPGLDGILVADRLEDVTTFQVLDELARRPRTAATPVILLSSAEDSEELYGDKVAAIVQGAEDVEAIEAALAESVNRDREEADRMAASAAEALTFLAQRGDDVSGAAGALVSTLAHRSDAVTVPAMRALGASGSEGAVEALVAVQADEARSEEARVAAGEALAAIFQRGARPSAEALASLLATLGSDAPQPVKDATALAVGNSGLGGAEFAQLLANPGAAPSN